MIFSVWEKHMGAVITAVAAIGAAGVTAFFTASATRDVAREQGHEAVARQLTDARGAARVLLSEFLVAGNEISDWVVNGTWHRFGREYPITIQGDDLRLIASRVAPRQWIWVQAALADVTELGRYVAQRSTRQSRFRGFLLSRHAIRIAARDLRSIGRASRALRRLAGLANAPYLRIDVPTAIANLRRISRATGVPIAEN